MSDRHGLLKKYREVPQRDSDEIGIKDALRLKHEEMVTSSKADSTTNEAPVTANIRKHYENALRSIGRDEAPSDQREELNDLHAKHTREFEQLTTDHNNKLAKITSNFKSKNIAKQMSDSYISKETSQSAQDQWTSFTNQSDEMMVRHSREWGSIQMKQALDAHQSSANPFADENEII